MNVELKFYFLLQPIDINELSLLLLLFFHSNFQMLQKLDLFVIT